MAWLGISCFEDVYVYGYVRSRNFIIAVSISFFPASLCPMRERRKNSGISCIEFSSLISRACSGGWPAHALSSTVLLLRADRSRWYHWSLSERVPMTYQNKDGSIIGHQHLCLDIHSGVLPVHAVLCNRKTSHLNQLLLLTIPWKWIF